MRNELAFKIQYVYIFYPEILLLKLSYTPTRAQKYAVRMFTTVIFITETTGNHVNAPNRGIIKYNLLYPDCRIFKKNKVIKYMRKSSR